MVRNSGSRSARRKSFQCNLSCFGTDHESTIIVGFVGKIKRVEELICPRVLRFSRGDGVDMQLIQSKWLRRKINCQNTRWRGIKVLERFYCQIFLSALLQHRPKNKLSAKWLDKSLSVFKQQHFNFFPRQYLLSKIIPPRGISPTKTCVIANLAFHSNSASRTQFWLQFDEIMGKIVESFEKTR